MSLVSRAGAVLVTLGGLVPSPWGPLVVVVGRALQSGDDEGLALMERELAAMPSEVAMDAARSQAFADELARRTANPKPAATVVIPPGAR